MMVLVVMLGRGVGYPDFVYRAWWPNGPLLCLSPGQAYRKGFSQSLG